MQLARETVAFLFLRADDARAHKLVFLHGLDFPHDAVELIREVGEHGADGQGQMLCLVQQAAEAAQTQFHVVALEAQLLFLVALDAELYLHVLYFFVARANAFLRIMGEVARDAHELLLFLLFLHLEDVDAVDDLARLFFQLIELATAGLHFLFGRFVDLEDLCLVILDRMDGTGQDFLQRAIPGEFLLHRIGILLPLHQHHLLFKISIHSILPKRSPQVKSLCTCFSLHLPIKYKRYNVNG